MKAVGESCVISEVINRIISDSPVICIRINGTKSVIVAKIIKKKLFEGGMLLEANGRQKYNYNKLYLRVHPYINCGVSLKSCKAAYIIFL